MSGNSKTNDHVIIREIRTKPGDLFSRSDIMRSQREIATLNYFDPEKLNIDVDPNQEDGTVDLNYIVEEKSSDQIELQEAMVQIESSEHLEFLLIIFLLKIYLKMVLGHLYHLVMDNVLAYQQHLMGCNSNHITSLLPSLG